MARQLPRFQESGLISADVPRMDFANIRESGRFSQSIAENLDRISNFAFGQAEKQQKEEQRILGIQLRADLESEVQKELTNLDVMVETGQLSNFDDIQNRVKSLQGMARGLAEVDQEQANGLMRSISTGGGALLRKSSDVLVKAYGVQRDFKTDETIGNLRRNLETLYSVETNPEMVEQYEAGARNIIYAMARQNPGSLQKKMEDYEKARIAARTSAVASYIASPEFAPNATRAIEMISSGNVGKYSDLWNRMTEAEKDDVFNRIKKSSDNKRAFMDSEFASAEAVAAPLVRQLLAEEDPAKRRALVQKLQALPLSPEKLKTYQGYVDDAGQFAKVDDANLLLTLTRKAASGTLEDSELLDNKGRLTKETFTSLVRNIANPNENLRNFNQIFDRTVGIQSANLPPELPTAEARASAIAARNGAILELERYANTPVNGVLPSTADVTAMGRKIQQNLSAGMSDVFSKAADTTQSDAVALVPDLSGVDLTNDAAVEKAFETYLNRNKKGQATVQAARESITRYRQYKQKVPQK